MKNEIELSPSTYLLLAVLVAFVATGGVFIAGIRNSQASINRAEWAQVYWLKRQALAAGGCECVDTLIEPMKPEYE